MKGLLIWLIRLYQRRGRSRPRCLFEPSCSEYAIGALTRYGVVRGTVRTVKRIWRCRPGGGGYDPP